MKCRNQANRLNSSHGLLSHQFQAALYALKPLIKSI
jgi:hypothetical protein